MYEGCLLERIRHLEEKPAERGRRDVSGGVRSIINYLKKVLNTRQGSVPVADDFGMPDITNFQGDDITTAAKEIESIISQVIQKYEPRLQNVHVSFVPHEANMMSLRFKLEAEMIGSREKEGAIPVVFETVVTSEGMVKLEE